MTPCFRALAGLPRALPVFLALCAAACFSPGDDPPLAPAAETETGTTGTTGTAGSTDTGDLAPSSESGRAETSTGDDGAVEACADYCSLITDHCSDDEAQYSGTALCESACANMPAGNPGDDLGNSVACRTFHSVLAAEDPEEHCLHAGPAGDGICGADCESFCVLAFNTCPGALSPYPDSESCIAACEGFAPEPSYSAEVPDGDTFACRLRHLTLASLQPEIHCSHIAPESPVCFD